MIQHLNKHHSQNLSVRARTTKRTNQNGFVYVPSETEAGECHSACPSCQQHFPEADRQAFITHLDTVHAGPRQPHLQAKKPVPAPQANKPSPMEADTAGSSGGNSSTVTKHKDDASTRLKVDFFDALDNLVVAVNLYLIVVFLSSRTTLHPILEKIEQAQFQKLTTLTA